MDDHHCGIEMLSGRDQIQHRILPKADLILALMAAIAAFGKFTDLQVGMMHQAASVG